MVFLLFTLALSFSTALALPAARAVSSQTLFPKVTLVSMENHTPACVIDPNNLPRFYPGCPSPGNQSVGGCGDPAQTSLHIYWGPTPWFNAQEQVKAGGSNSVTCSWSATFEFEAGKYKMSPTLVTYSEFGHIDGGSSVTVQTSTSWSDNVISTPVCPPYTA